MTEYDRGFNDGLRLVADALRRSAFLVEKAEYADFEKKNGGGIVRAITKVGQTHYAKQLREVAKTIEDAIDETIRDSK